MKRFIVWFRLYAMKLSLLLVRKQCTVALIKDSLDVAEADWPILIYRFIDWLKGITQLSKSAVFAMAKQNNEQIVQSG